MKQVAISYLLRLIGFNNSLVKPFRYDQKFNTYYDASISATVAEMRFYDLLVSNDGK